MKKLPWGIFAGICAIVVFFATAAVIAAFLILSSIALQTNHTASLFGTWWQTLLFVLDIGFILGFIGSLVMYVRTHRAAKK